MVITSQVRKKKEKKNEEILQKENKNGSDPKKPFILIARPIYEAWKQFCNGLGSYIIEFTVCLVMLLHGTVCLLPGNISQYCLLFPNVGSRFQFFNHEWAP